MTHRPASQFSRYSEKYMSLRNGDQVNQQPISPRIAAQNDRNYTRAITPKKGLLH